jgi:hypothetical protein
MIPAVLEIPSKVGAFSPSPQLGALCSPDAASQRFFRNKTVHVSHVMNFVFTTWQQQQQVQEPPGGVLFFFSREIGVAPLTCHFGWTTG